MKLIIDIPEKDYEIFKELTPHYIDFMYHGADERLILATRDGIPLKDEVMLATLMSLVTDKDYKPKLEGEKE